MAKIHFGIGECEVCERSGTLMCVETLLGPYIVDARPEDDSTVNIAVCRRCILKWLVRSIPENIIGLAEDGREWVERRFRKGYADRSDERIADELTRLRTDQRCEEES